MKGSWYRKPGCCSAVTEAERAKTVELRSIGGGDGSGVANLFETRKYSVPVQDKGWIGGSVVFCAFVFFPIPHFLVFSVLHPTLLSITLSCSPIRPC